MKGKCSVRYSPGKGWTFSVGAISSRTSYPTWEQAAKACMEHVEGDTKARAALAGKSLNEKLRMCGLVRPGRVN